MVSTHISSSGLMWELGDKDILLSNNNDSNIENDYFIVQISPQMNMTTLKTNHSTFISNLIKFIKYILYID